MKIFKREKEERGERKEVRERGGRREEEEEVMIKILGFPA